MWSRAIQFFFKHSNSQNFNCKVSNCKLKLDFCEIPRVVYNIKCEDCNRRYYGSTMTRFHIMYDEHLKRKTSSVFKHKSQCPNGKHIISIIKRCKNEQVLLFTEALLIKKEKPELNAREEINCINLLLV